MVCPDCGNGNERKETVKLLLQKHFEGIHASEPSVLLFCDDAEEIAAIPPKMIERYTDDTPLLIFKNSKDLQNGIVITECGICTGFLGLIQTLTFDQIESGWCGKAFSRYGMKFNLHGGGESKAFDLNALNDPENFVHRLNAFLADLPELEKAPVQLDLQQIDAILIETVKAVPFKDDLSVKLGTPIASDIPKYAKAVNRFAIPQDEKIYLIYDETLFGSCKVGFAITSSGLFYRHKKQAGHCAWAELATLRIFADSTLSIGEMTFYCSAATGESVSRILKMVLAKLKA